MVALRFPSDGRWYGFWSLTLLFGASDAVLHYNAFSRIVAVWANKIFGIPVVNYFDDLGSLLNSSLEITGLRTFSQFCGLIAFILKDIKTLAGRYVAFLGLEGSFPDPSNGMLLSIDLTDGEKKPGHLGLKIFPEKGKSVTTN